jgi:acetate kinase
MRDVEAAAAKGDEHAILALKMFRYGIIKYVGAYAAAMQGVDLIIFTGGIGENDPVTREAVAKQFEFMGVDFDADANKNMKRGEPAIISKKNSKVIVAVVPTDEELMIATDTMEIVSSVKGQKK